MCNNTNSQRYPPSSILNSYFSLCLQALKKFLELFLSDLLLFEQKLCTLMKLLLILAEKLLSSFVAAVDYAQFVETKRGHDVITSLREYMVRYFRKM